MTEPKRFPTLYECKLGQGEKGNCFRWALERVLSKFVYMIAYPPSENPDEKSQKEFTITFENRDYLDQPIPYDTLIEKKLSKVQINYVYTRIALTQFFGDWITLYCGSEGDVKEAYKVLDVETSRVTDADVFTHPSMCGSSSLQSFANVPEVLVYNFSRIVNFILTQNVGNRRTQITNLIQMKYPICLGIRDPTIDEINTAYERFYNRESGRGDNTFNKYYREYVDVAFNNFFTNLSIKKQFLDIKSITLHRKPYVIYNKDDTQMLVPQIDISVGGVSENKTDKVPNNYFGDIQKQLEQGLYAEVSVYMPGHNSSEYFEGLQTLTTGEKLKKALNESMTTRSGNIKITNTIRSMSRQLPYGENIAGHSMALKGIRVVTPEEKDATGKPQKPQIYITFINSWEDQEYVEYPVNIFYRVDVHALIPVVKNPGHIRGFDSSTIFSKYMELGMIVPSCVPEYMLTMVNNRDDSFRRTEGAPQYRVILANSQRNWNNVLRVTLGNNNSSIKSSPENSGSFSPFNSPFEEPRQNRCELSPIKIAWDKSPEQMEICTPEKCSNLPEYNPYKKRKPDEENFDGNNVNPSKSVKQDNETQYYSATDVDSESEDYDGGAKNKTNKRRLKPRKRVTRKLKKKRATCRVSNCRILKRHTHKKRNNKNNPNHKKKQNKQTKRK